jgi:hypothetical protein
MGYSIPNFIYLIDQVAILKISYQLIEKKNNIDRYELIGLLEAVAQVIHDMDVSHVTTHQKLFTELLLGAYIFCLESISSQYKLFNPAHTEGYFFNSGSMLYKLLSQQLQLSESNQLNDIDRLIYLSKFHNVIFNKNKNKIKKYLEQNQSQYEVVEQQVRYTIRSVLNRSDNDVKKIMHAIPSEIIIDSKMANLSKHYLKQRVTYNPKRIFIIQLVEAVLSRLAVNRCLKTSYEDDENRVNSQHKLTHTQRIKIGLILYIIQSITLTYPIRSPRHHSVLYDLCCDILNIKTSNDIDEETKLACLTAFESFLIDKKLLEELENKTHQPIELSIRNIRHKLNVMIDTILANHSIQEVSSITKAAASIGALMMAVPGYGLGYVIGYGLNQTNLSIEPKTQLSLLTGYAMKIFFGTTGNYLSYYGANLILEATLERAFGKIFGALGMLIGAAAGGTMSIIIFDLSYKTLKELCSLYIYIYHHLTPNMINHADYRLIECLLSLPPDIFSDEQKNKLKSIADLSFFQTEDAISVTTLSKNVRCP